MTPNHAPVAQVGGIISADEWCAMLPAGWTAECGTYHWGLATPSGLRFAVTPTGDVMIVAYRGAGHRLIDSGPLPGAAAVVEYVVTIASARGDR